MKNFIILTRSWTELGWEQCHCQWWCLPLHHCHLWMVCCRCCHCQTDSFLATLQKYFRVCGVKIICVLSGCCVRTDWSGSDGGDYERLWPRVRPHHSTSGATIRGSQASPGQWVVSGKMICCALLPSKEDLMLSELTMTNLSLPAKQLPLINIRILKAKWEKKH